MFTIVEKMLRKNGFVLGNAHDGSDCYVLFVAPTTTERRLQRVVAAGPPFVYGIAEVGVTGERVAASSHIAELVSRIRSHSQVPVVAGVGISTPEQARAAARSADGVIVGSALVRQVLEADDSRDAVDRLRVAVSEFAAAVRDLAD